MNAIQKRFGKARVLLPVVHCIEETQARTAVNVAMGAGADGVFLINQGGMSARHVAIFATSLPVEMFVGLNLLGNTAAAQIATDDDAIDAVWSDRCDLDGDLPRPRLFFGGVAFKGQPVVWDVAEAALAAVSACVDVVTTSGPGTGEPPTVEKVAAMRAAIGTHALAVASGITPENVERFLPFVDAFLVASGIENRFGTFDPKRVRALADAIHGWQA
jgi:deoxyribose-phosphate aldolase